MDVVGIGMPCVDLLARIDEIPKENMGTKMHDYSWQGGGKVPTAIVALARLGAQCGIIGVVGECNYGRFCLNDFREHGIDTTKMIIDEDGETSFAIILADNATHGRSIIYHSGNNRSLRLDDLDKRYIQSARYLHLDSATPVAKQAAIWAKEKDTVVVYDADVHNQSLEEMLPLIDVFIGSEMYYKSQYYTKEYETNCRELQKAGPGIVVFTLGERGCVGIQGDEFFIEKGFKVEVMDTTGAGDVYHGAFIFGLLQDWSAKKTAHFSNAVSAIKCTRMGGRAGIPTLETVIRYLETGSIDYEEIDKRVSKYRKSI